ncbi:uncharacterized protein LOC110920356 [Helianthus annuus]|uniref:uncharacterized protein LOC110920356 n=1 Tax=Helianthus annuus TaxID=4232 RepID=UPI000B8EE964|nr:uncharacterized protein LOC110920356 [Helianthus annuus]
MESNTLWAKVIESLHGSDRKVEAFPFKKSRSGVWKNIGEIGKDFSKRNININTSLCSKVGRGDKTLFWVDTWYGSEPLRTQFPCLYQLSTRKRAKVQEVYKIVNGGILWDWTWSRAPSSGEEKAEMESLKQNLQKYDLSVNEDVWVWKQSEKEDFSVKNVRLSLDRIIDINSEPNQFYWNKWATAKSTAFVWRAIDEKIPSAVALANRGMEISDTSCKLCGEDNEDAVHILMKCNFARRVWDGVETWTGLPMTNDVNNVKDLLKRILDSNRSQCKRKFLHAIAIQTMWLLWKNRNDKIFSGRRRTVQMLIEEIKDTSFLGVKQRSKHRSITKQQWWEFSFNL